uniref:(northern house mosquito) hypothetical protein n=1 Tax=Culex pipiens TaxID=7175 RepID=A0A8D8MVY5_CULPI
MCPKSEEVLEETQESTKSFESKQKIPNSPSTEGQIRVSADFWNGCVTENTHVFQRHLIKTWALKSSRCQSAATMRWMATPAEEVEVEAAMTMTAVGAACPNRQCPSRKSNGHRCATWTNTSGRNVPASRRRASR